MVILMIIIGILVVATFPRALTKDSATILARAEQLATELRYVQALSMTTGARYCLSLTSSSYSLATAASSCATPVQSAAGLTSPIPLCVDSACLSWTNLPSNLIQFDGRGKPYTDATGTIALASAAIITVTGSGISKTVSISPETGRVIVQ